MKKILLATTTILIVLFSSSVYIITISSYKSEELGIEFKYPSKYKEPSIDQISSHWYYMPDINPLWSLRILLEEAPIALEEYYSRGAIHIRAFNESDLSYENLLTELKNDTEVGKLEGKKIRDKKALIYTASGESSASFAFLFGKKYIIQIEMRHGDPENKTFQRILKTIKF